MVSPAVYVLLTEGLARSPKDAHGVNSPGELRILEALQIRSQDRHLNATRNVLQGFHHVDIVRHLGDPLRTHVARRLDAPDPGVDETPTERDLHVSWYRHLLVLKAV